MPFLSNNARGGLKNTDPGRIVERGVGLPWAADPVGSYAYYDCTVGVMLDSGIVVHNRLPQVNNVPDTLSSMFLDTPEFNNTNKGVNLVCNDQYADIVQRMGHARYWFRLWGMALRVGYRIPIPGIKTIGGVPAIPYDRNPQWAYNSLVPLGNFGGIPLWRAVWSLWYTTAAPPSLQSIPEGNPTVDSDGKMTLPKTIQAPYSQPDDNAVTNQLARTIQRR